MDEGERVLSRARLGWELAFCVLVCCPGRSGWESRRAAQGAAVTPTGPRQGLEPALMSQLLVPSLARKSPWVEWGFWERPVLAPPL